VDKEHLCIIRRVAIAVLLGRPSGWLEGGMWGTWRTGRWDGETAPLAICRSALKIALVVRKDVAMTNSEV